MKKHGIKYGELRTINSKNFVFWSDEEVSEFSNKIKGSGIEIVAAATPLFKWYSSPDNMEIKHDNFGFNPRLSPIEKKAVIIRTIEIANMLKIPRLRIFSELGNKYNYGKIFANNELLKFTLIEAAKHNIDILVENEPVCNLRKKQDLMELVANNSTTNLKIWLDIANIIEQNENIDRFFINKIKNRIGYIHIKNFVFDDGIKEYVAIKDGNIDYKKILSLLKLYCSNCNISVETHAKSDNKITFSEKSLEYLKDIIHKSEVSR